MLNQIDIQDIIAIAKKAGNAVMQIYKQDFEVEYKQDSSPLTLADKKANVLIFDEATSALDSDTEQAVMESIRGLEGGPTILIIAHRISTLKNCDSIIRLDKNNIIHTTSYMKIANEK